MTRLSNYLIHVNIASLGWIFLFKIWEGFGGGCILGGHGGFRFHWGLFTIGRNIQSHYLIFSKEIITTWGCNRTIAFFQREHSRTTLLRRKKEASTMHNTFNTCIHRWASHTHLRASIPATPRRKTHNHGVISGKPT